MMFDLSPERQGKIDTAPAIVKRPAFFASRRTARTRERRVPSFRRDTAANRSPPFGKRRR
jgi:hypothetical protein